MGPAVGKKAVEGTGSEQKRDSNEVEIQNAIDTWKASERDLDWIVQEIGPTAIDRCS